MKRSGNTVLITGGGSGIGFALAERFIANGDSVIVFDRDPEALRTAKEKAPGLVAIEGDMGAPSDREALVERIRTRHPALNVLVNNAGVQRRIDFAHAPPWSAMAEEIEINLAGPVHLITALTPDLLRQDEPRIVNVSSNLALVPLAPMPVYCATKAALHAISQTLRHQLRDTALKVMEVLPPPVRTNLGGSHDFGEPLDTFADAVMAQLLDDVPEITLGMGVSFLRLEQEGPGAMFTQMNEDFERSMAARGAR